MGEVDLIARRGKMVAFIEVKARTSAADLDFAIDERRLSRVAAAARTLAAKYARPGDDMRIDVMLIAPRRFPRPIGRAHVRTPVPNEPIVCRPLLVIKTSTTQT